MTVLRLRGVPVSPDTQPSRSGDFPCQAANYNPVEYDRCRSTTASPQRNRAHCVGCACMWRLCYVCLEYGIQHDEESWVVNPATGLCKSHTLELEQGLARWNTKPLPPAPQRPTFERLIRVQPHGETQAPEAIPARVPASEKKPAPPVQEVAALTEVDFPPSVIARMANRVTHLRRREMAVAELLSKEFTNPQIAEALDISEPYAGVLVSNIYRKLNVPHDWKDYRRTLCGLAYMYYERRRNEPRRRY